MNQQEQIPAIARAMQSVAEAAARVSDHPARPLFHFRPPANWMNDPNGTYYHNGYYHLFYQLNPYGDAWGNIHWGHARSSDLATWEHLPIALWPSLDSGEAHCYSGCAAVNGLGQPMLIYTSVGAGERGERPDNEQWAAIGSGDWVNWRKLTRNPVFSLHTHGGPSFEGPWRDPYIFTSGEGEEKRTFLVLGGNVGTRACVALYEASTPSLTEWSYRGIPYETTIDASAFCECPNFLRVGDKWILLTSPYRPVEYVVGDFDLENYTFSPQTAGVLDPGYNDLDTKCFYATNTAIAPDGRTILFGWVRGFPTGQGWNGCLALPRVLTIADDGTPRQHPAKELEALRGAHHALAGNDAQTKDLSLSLASNTLEIALQLQVGAGVDITAGDGESAAHIRLSAEGIQVNQQVAPLPVVEDNPEGAIDLRLFLDRSVLEIFVGDGRLAITQVIPLLPATPTLGIALADDARLLNGDVWEMKAIW